MRCGHAAQCDESRSTQSWTWTNQTGGTPSKTFVTTCDPSDPLQQWSFVGSAGATLLKSAATGKCIDASGQSDPVQIATCNPASTSQFWVLDPAGHLVNNATEQCLDVDNFNVRCGRVKRHCAMGLHFLPNCYAARRAPTLNSTSASPLEKMTQTKCGLRSPAACFAPTQQN